MGSYNYVDLFRNNDLRYRYVFRTSVTLIMRIPICISTITTEYEWQYGSHNIASKMVLNGFQ